MQTEAPSIFDIADGEPKLERYAVPGTGYTLTRAQPNRYAPVLDGKVDKRLAHAINTRFCGRSMTAALMHEVGRFVQDNANAD